MVYCSQSPFTFRAVIKFLVFVFFFLVSLTCEASDKYLTQSEIKIIRDNWEDYKYASEKTGIPFLILPAIHYRECQLYSGWHSFKREVTIKNIGGPFMLDRGPLNDGIEFEKRIRAYEKKVYNLYCGESSKIPKVSDVFRFAALCAAHELKQKRHCKEWDWNCLVDAVWGYNGRASWCKQSESAYLWSDPKMGTKFISRYKTNDGKIIQYFDKRPGVMIIYKELLDLKQKEGWHE